MVVAIENHKKPESCAHATSYEAGHLEGILAGLQSKQWSGITYIETFVPQGLVSHHCIVWREGAIVYAGRSLPSPHEFVIGLARHSHIGVLDTVLQFAAKRSSIQGVMRAMVEIGVLQWPQIVSAARKQIQAVLGELLPLAGRVSFGSDIADFDLHYGEEEGSGFALDALLLERKLHDRSQEPPTAAPQSKGVILSIDDSPVAQVLVKRILESEYAVLTCDRALAGLRILNGREDIAVVLLDLTLPDVNGLAFCRMLRDMERFKGLPIIMLTARDGVVDRVRGQFAGTTHYLTKPVKPEALKAAVAQYVVA